MVPALLMAAVFLLTGCTASDRSDSASHPLAVENRLYSIEIAAARKNQIYLVFDLFARNIQVKIRGQTLRQFSVLDLKVHRPWPGMASAETIRKTGIGREPRRSVIDPPKNPGHETDTQTVVLERVEDSLELEDMPSVYSIEFDGGAQILVLPRSKHPLGFFQKVTHLGVRTLFFFKRLIAGRAPAVTVVLQSDDARALYWNLLTDAPGAADMPVRQALISTSS